MSMLRNAQQSVAKQAMAKHQGKKPQPIQDTLHFLFGCTVIYSLVHATGLFGTSTLQKSQFRNEWKGQNPHWRDDPYFFYHTNIMRMAKKNDFEIVATRPAYFAAKELRDKHGFSLQPPYLILPPDQRSTALIDLERDTEWDI